MCDRSSIAAAQVVGVGEDQRLGADGWGLQEVAIGLLEQPMQLLERRQLARGRLGREESQDGGVLTAHEAHPASAFDLRGLEYATISFEIEICKETAEITRSFSYVSIE